MKSALVLLLAAASLRADTLADVRAAVSVLRATTPIHATFDITRARTSSGRFVNHSVNGSASIDVASDASGLRLTFAPSMLARAAREEAEHEADPKKPSPTRTALDETQPTDVADAINFAASMLHLLDIAKRESETRVTRDGRPARLLVLKLTPKLPPEATSVWNVKFTQDRLNLWIGDDNLPIAAERVRHGTAGFLFLRGEMTTREVWTFAHPGDRLVATRYETSFAASGFGQRGEGKNVQTVTVR